MLTKPIRQFLFILLHLAVTILVAVQNAYRRYFIKKPNLPTTQVTKQDIFALLENVPKMKNRLKHLVVLADSKAHSMNDLAQMVIWSLVIGIPYISFYDITGDLKEREEELFLEIEKKKKGIPGCIKWSNKPDLNGYTNGIQSHTIFINIFSLNDGRAKISECIKGIAKAELKCEKDSEEFTVLEFGNTLQQICPSVPDPDLILYTGPLCCTFGCLPWHIRLTEFIQLSVNNNFNINSYLGALYKYNKCDQRFGK